MRVYECTVTCVVLESVQTIYVYRNSNSSHVRVQNVRREQHEETVILYTYDA